MAVALCGLDIHLLVDQLNGQNFSTLYTFQQLVCKKLFGSVVKFNWSCHLSEQLITFNQLVGTLQKVNYNLTIVQGEIFSLIHHNMQMFRLSPST